MKKIIFNSVLLLALFSCSDSDGLVEENNDALLPKVIKTQTRAEMPDIIFYTYIYTFNYDNLNRPTEIFCETYYNKGRETENTFYSSVSKKIEYLTDNIIIETVQEKNSVSTITATRKYMPDIEDNSIINIIIDNNLKETIELGNGFALKYNGLDFVETYQYNENKEISQYSYSKGTYSFVEKYEYDNKKGIFSSMNIPQWLFISLFDDKGYADNVKKIYYLNDNEFVNYATFNNEYNNENYPIKRIFQPDSNIEGLGGSNTIIEYINAKIL